MNDDYRRTSQHTSPARAAQLLNAAVRAAEDPAQVRKAARIVRAALHAGRLTRAELSGEIVRPIDLVAHDA